MARPASATGAPPRLAPPPRREYSPIAGIQSMHARKKNLALAKRKGRSPRRALHPDARRAPRARTPPRRRPRHHDRRHLDAFESRSGRLARPSRRFEPAPCDDVENARDRDLSSFSGPVTTRTEFLMRPLPSLRRSSAAPARPATSTSSASATARLTSTSTPPSTCPMSSRPTVTSTRVTLSSPPSPSSASSAPVPSPSSPPPPSKRSTMRS